MNSAFIGYKLYFFYIFRRKLLRFYMLKKCQEMLTFDLLAPHLNTSDLQGTQTVKIQKFLMERKIAPSQKGKEHIRNIERQKRPGGGCRLNNSSTSTCVSVRTPSTTSLCFPGLKLKPRAS